MFSGYGIGQEKPGYVDPGPKYNACLGSGHDHRDGGLEMGRYMGLLTGPIEHSRFIAGCLTSSRALLQLILHGYDFPSP